MITLSKRFGGLNNRIEAHLLGPEQAQDLLNVNLDSQGIKPLKDVAALSPAVAGVGTLQSVYKFKGQWLLSADNYQYVEYAGLLFRVKAGSRPEKSTNGIDFYPLGIDAPATALTAAAGAAGVLTGTYTYYVTFVSAFGSESAPSLVSTGVNVTAKQMSLSSIPVSTDTQVTKRRVYRAGGGAVGTLLVTEIADNVTTTFTDNVADTSLGTSLTTASYGVPPSANGIAVTPYGVFFVWDDNTLYFSEQGTFKFDAWPATNTITFNEDIVACVPSSGTLLVLTTAAPYVLLGTNLTTFRIVNTLSQQGCLGRDTAVDMGNQVFYLSPDGICAFAGNNTEVISKTSLSDAFIASIVTGSVRAVRYNERYLLFHSTGIVEFDARVQPPWKKSDIVANAVHYNRTDDVLYVAQTADVKQWEAGANKTYTYWLGDWSGEVTTILKHYRHIAVQHVGDVSVQVYVDGVQVGDTEALSRDTLGLSVFPMPMGAFGHRISVKLTGTGTVIEVLVGLKDMGQVYVFPY